MKVDNKLEELPLTKTNPSALMSLFGAIDLQAMWVADSDLQIADEIQKALINRISGSGFGYEYKPDSFFEKQRLWYSKQYNIVLNREAIIFSPSIPTSIVYAIENLTEVGDGIIIQPPVWSTFRDIIRHTHRKIIKNPLKLSSGYYKVDFDDLASKAEENKNKILILCNPHNPVGRVWKRDELHRIVQICKENELILISDEIHKDVILFENKFTSILNFTDTFNDMIVCTSEAKTFNLPGISDSMMVIPNNIIHQNLEKTLKKYHLGRTNALTRVALEAAYTHGEKWLKELRQLVETNIKGIEDELDDSKSLIKLIRPEGTFQAWLDFREIFNDSKEMFSYITMNSKIALNAGHWFGREGALFMRMNIASDTRKVKKAIQSLIAAAADKTDFG